MEHRVSDGEPWVYKQIKRKFEIKKFIAHRKGQGRMQTKTGLGLQAFFSVHLCRYWGLKLWL